MNDALFSHESDEWGTPDRIFDKLDAEFGLFDFDVAATAANTKCARYYTQEDSGLDSPWGSRNWCNPPYSKLNEFVQKARREQLKGNMTVMLLPARTDRIVFHDYIYNKPNVEIRFVRGRITFVNAPGQAPFPSMIVIFRS